MSARSVPARAGLAVVGVTFGPHDGEAPVAVPHLAGTATTCDLVLRPHVLVVTCHRVELLLDADGLDADELDEVRRAFTSVVGLEPGHEHVGRDAVRYLFEVACGLRSPLLGDTEVLGQLRRAWRGAAECGRTSPALDRSVRLAIEVGARARLDTEIAAGGAGVAGAVHAAVERWASRRGLVRPHGVLVVGAGSAGRGIARRLAKHRVGPITIANRSPAPARDLAGEVGGTAVGIDDVPRHLHAAGVIVSAVPHPVLTSGVLARAVAMDPAWAPLIVDVGSPPSVGPVDGPEIVRLDDLHTRRDAVARRREASVPAVRELIEQQLVVHRRTVDTGHDRTTTTRSRHRPVTSSSVATSLATSLATENQQCVS